MAAECAGERLRAQGHRVLEKQKPPSLSPRQPLARRLPPLGPGVGSGFGCRLPSGPGPCSGGRPGGGPRALKPSPRALLACPSRPRRQGLAGIDRSVPPAGLQLEQAPQGDGSLRTRSPSVRCLLRWGWRRAGEGEGGLPPRRCSVMLQLLGLGWASRGRAGAGAELGARVCGAAGWSDPALPGFSGLLPGEVTVRAGHRGGSAPEATAQDLEQGRGLEIPGERVHARSF